MILMNTIWIPSDHPEGSALLWVARPSEQCRPRMEIHDSCALTKVCMLFVCFLVCSEQDLFFENKSNAKAFSQACFSLVKPVIGTFKFTMSHPLDKLCNNRLALCDHASGSSFVCIRGFAAKLVWVYKSGLERTRRTRINEALYDCRYSRYISVCYCIWLLLAFKRTLTSTLRLVPSCGRPFAFVTHRTCSCQPPSTIAFQSKQRWSLNTNADPQYISVIPDRQGGALTSNILKRSVPFSRHCTWQVQLDIQKSSKILAFWIFLVCFKLTQRCKQHRLTVRTSRLTLLNDLDKWIMVDAINPSSLSSVVTPWTSCMCLSAIASWWCSAPALEQDGCPRPGSGWPWEVDP